MIYVSQNLRLFAHLRRPLSGSSPMLPLHLPVRTSDDSTPYCMIPVSLRGWRIRVSQPPTAIFHSIRSPARGRQTELSVLGFHSRPEVLPFVAPFVSYD